MKKYWKMLKKPLALMVALVLVAALVAGCSGGGGGGGAASTPAATGDSGAASTPAATGDAPSTIKVGYVGPLTGPMSTFTVGIKYTAEEALKVMNAEGGYYIKEYDQKIPVEVIWGDSESDATKASEVATKFATVDKVDILLGQWTPVNINPVSVVGERYQVPTVLCNSPSESWLEAGPYDWAFGILFNWNTVIEEYFGGFETLETNKKIGLILDNNVDGVLLADLMKVKADEYGYTIVDPGRFPEGTNDYTTVIKELMDQDCEIMVASLFTPELVTLWNQTQQMGYTPKVCVLGKAMHFATDIQLLGDNDAGAMVCIETQWVPEFPFTSTLTGKTAKELSDEFAEAIGQSPDLTLGWDWAFFDVIDDVLNRAQTLDKEGLRQAFSETDLDCIYGHIKFNEDNVGIVPITFGQWVPDEKWGYRKVIVSAKLTPEITETFDLQPMPWSES